MRQALRVHLLSTYLVFRAVSALVAVAYAGVLPAGGAVLAVRDRTSV